MQTQKTKGKNYLAKVQERLCFVINMDARKLIIIFMEKQPKALQKRRTFSQDSVNRILIGVTGGSASGKTTLCENIQKLMSFDANFNVLLIALDSFYKQIDKTKHKAEDYNFDHPDALDFDMAYEVLKTLLRGEEAQVPQYCFVNHARKKEVDQVCPTQVIIFEGILALYDRRIRDLMKYKIFINCDDDVRLCRRIKRDVEQRGRTVQGVLLQYHRFVKDAYTGFIAPTMKYADLVVPGFRNNKTSVTFIVQHLKTLTRQMQFFKSALTTRIYFYGEVIDVLLQQAADQSSVLLDIQDQMQYIFPISQDLKKQLDLFMNQLVSERFTLAYYKSTFIHQFIRILIIQFMKLIGVKKYSRDSIQFLEIINLKNGVKAEFDDTKTVHAIFIPMLTKEVFTTVIQAIDEKPKEHIFLILNIWCDHKQIMRFKKKRNCCIINLFCLCQQKKFIDIVVSNVRDSVDQKTLFFNQKLITKSYVLFKEAISNQQFDSDY